MLCMATKNVQLSFKDLIFGQTGDDVMGSRLGPILANIFVKYYEKKNSRESYLHTTLQVR